MDYKNNNTTSKVREMKIGSKNRTVQEIGVKSQCLTQEKEMTFVMSYQEVQKSHSLRNQDSTALIISCHSLL